MRFKFPVLLRHKALDEHDRTVPVNLLTYFTPGIIATLVTASFAIWSNWDMLSKSFGSGVVLNGMIIVIGLIGVLRSVWSNFRCLVTARFLQAIDDVRTRPAPLTEDEMKAFRRALKKEGRLLDIKQMADLLENLPSKGHLNVTDNDARMIKSKLGFRVSLMRANAGFLAGILVMLGLLGTFLGLLTTIDAVGVAMTSMSNIGGEDPDAMSGFLAKISAPLAGMGLAFSSSLFGLAGSLLLSFTNFLASGVHDRFIERVSRWIDDRIPSPTQQARKAQENPKVAGSDELKAWLAGFAQSALDTNRRIDELISVISEQMKSDIQTSRTHRVLLAQGKANQDELKELRRSFGRGLSVVRKEINDRFFDLARRFGVRHDRAGSMDLARSDSHDTLDVTNDPTPTGATANAPLRSLEESHNQLSSLVEELQSLLDGQDLMQAFRARQTEVDSDGLPPTFKDTDQGAAGLNRPGGHHPA